MSSLRRRYDAIRAEVVERTDHAIVRGVHHRASGGLWGWCAQEGCTAAIYVSTGEERVLGVSAPCPWTPGPRYWLTTAEVAAELGLAPATVRRDHEIRPFEHARLVPTRDGQPALLVGDCCVRARAGGLPCRADGGEG